jgi:hypothetical protein
VVECLPSKCVELSSNSSTAKRECFAILKNESEGWLDGHSSLGTTGNRMNASRGNPHKSLASLGLQAPCLYLS